MTTVKRILAVMLAVMLIASIGIIGASAAGEKLTIDATGTNAKGFTFTVYQVATLNLSTGKYTPSGSIDASVQTALNTKGQLGAEFRAVLDAATNVGTSKGTLKESTMDITEPGIYYVKVTGWPDTQTKKLNTVIVWPEYKNNAYTLSNVTVALDVKVASGSDNVDKYFTDDTSATSKTLGEESVVYFTLEADVVGSADQKLQKYVIWDDMTKGLTYNNDMKVYYDVASGTPSTGDFTIATSTISSSDTYYNGGTHFTVTANDDTINGTAFYTHSKVYVTYSATVNNNATTGEKYNPNKDGLSYKNASGNTVDKNGPELKVYTAEAQAVKFDGSKSPKVALAGAKFGLFQDGTQIATGTSGADGKVIFNNGDDSKNGRRLAPGNYVVKELEAPSGYALSTAEYTVSITASGAQSGDGIVFANGTDGIDNFPIKLPQTGGNGTMMFTIIGACLVLLAGAMFVIIMKKRASSK